MRTYILKEKLSRPLLIIFIVFLLFFLKNVSDWWFILIYFFIILLLLIGYSYYKRDFYIHNYKVENGIIVIKYQKNLNNKLESISFKTGSIKSIKFKVDEFTEEFYTLSIYYIDDEELNDRKILKTNSKDMFIELLYELRKAVKVEAPV